MTDTLSYDQVIEMEANIKLKNEAEDIYKNFLKNIKLGVSMYKGDGKFRFWSDEHNAMYFQIRDDKFYFICSFLHENYTVEVTPAGIFTALKNKYRGVEHLSTLVSNSNYHK